MYINISNLKFSYNNSKELTINNLNLSLEKGDVLSILGESGSGKSTVLRLLSGLEIPMEGHITINEKVIYNSGSYIPPEKRGVGMVFQDYALFPHMTVKKNIMFGLNGLNKKQKEERIKELLNLVDLDGFENRYPYELSGGQQQRVALARSLAPKPELLLLDEPFSNLDAHLHEKIREELKQIIYLAGITSIFVTHDKNDALAISNKVMILDKGKIKKIGKTKEILANNSLMVVE